MNFDFNDDQKMLAGEARKFLDANCSTATVRKRASGVSLFPTPFT